MKGKEGGEKEDGVGKKIDEEKGGEGRGRVFLVSTKQLIRLGMYNCTFQSYGQYNLFTVLLFYVKSPVPEIHEKITKPRHLMFNKIININHVITKFATLVPHIRIIMCTNCGKKRTTFSEVTCTLNNRMDPSSLTGEWLTTVLYLR